MKIAFAVGAQCEWCISFHVHHAGKLGATRTEVIEAGLQAIVMHGGRAKNVNLWPEIGPNLAHLRAPPRDVM